MTAQEYINTQVAKYPHLDSEYFAYYMGRNSAEDAISSCPLEGALRAEWIKGRRDVRAEERLNADTEWDND